MTTTLTAVRAAADGSAVDELMASLEAALQGNGPAVLPIPTEATIRERLLNTLRPDDPAAPLEAEGIACVVATSGSEGDPKGVLLSAAALRAAGAALEQATAGRGHWLLALPAWHVGGLQVLARSVLAGTTPVAMDLKDRFTATAFVAATARLQQRAPNGPRYVSLVPTQLGRLLGGGPAAIAALASYDAVLVGSAATPPDLARQARENGVRLLLSYGMSETCGGCCYDGRPLPGVQIRLRGHDDRILVGGPTIFSGYRLRPALTASTLVDGEVVTPDIGRWDAGGRLEVLGRADDVVVTGGEKVSAAEVAAVLREHRSVAAAAVLGQPDPEWGQVLVAYVVGRRHGADLDAEELRQHVRDRLGRRAAPRRVTVLATLPMLPSGKLDRAALLALTPSRSET